MHTLEMRVHQRLPGVHQIVQDVLGLLAEDPLYLLIHPTRHHNRQRATQRRLHSIHCHHLRTHRFLDARHSVDLRVQCETRLLRVQTNQNCPLLPPSLQLSWSLNLSLPAPTFANAFTLSASRTMLELFSSRVSVDQDLSVIVAETLNDDDVKQRLVPIVFHACVTRQRSAGSKTRLSCSHVHEKNK